MKLLFPLSHIQAPITPALNLTHTFCFLNIWRAGFSKAKRDRKSNINLCSLRSLCLGLQNLCPTPSGGQLARLPESCDPQLQVLLFPLGLHPVMLSVVYPLDHLGQVFFSNQLRRKAGLWHGHRGWKKMRKTVECGSPFITSLTCQRYTVKEVPGTRAVFQCDHLKHWQCIKAYLFVFLLIFHGKHRFFRRPCLLNASLPTVLCKKRMNTSKQDTYLPKLIPFLVFWPLTKLSTPNWITSTSMLKVLNQSSKNIWLKS